MHNTQVSCLPLDCLGHAADAPANSEGLSGSCSWPHTVTCSLRPSVAPFQWPKVPQMHFHIFACIKQRSLPILESTEHALSSLWSCFRQPLTSGLLPEEFPITSALAREGLPGWFSVVSVEELVCR